VQRKDLEQNRGIIKINSTALKILKKKKRHGAYTCNLLVRRTLDKAPRFKSLSWSLYCVFELHAHLNHAHLNHAHLNHAHLNPLNVRIYWEKAKSGPASCLAEGRAWGESNTTPIHFMLQKLE